MIPGSKGLNPQELAHEWMQDLGTHPNMSIKVERKLHDMRIAGECVSAKHETIRGIILDITLRDSGA